MWKMYTSEKKSNAKTSCDSEEVITTTLQIFSSFIVVYQTNTEMNEQMFRQCRKDLRRHWRTTRHLMGKSERRIISALLVDDGAVWTITSSICRTGFYSWPELVIEESECVYVSKYTRRTDRGK